MGGTALAAVHGDFGEGSVGVFDDVFYFIEARCPDYVADTSSDCGAYLLKKYVNKEGRAILSSLNGGYSDIVITDDEDISLVGYLHKVL